jgi:FAD/FMN-containing dehydrogenase
VDHQTIIAWFEDEESAQEVGVKLVNGLISPEVISLVSGSLGSAVITAAGESPNSHESWTLVVRLGGGMRSVKRQVSEVTGAVGAGGAAGYAILDKTQDAICWTTLAEFEENTDLSVRVTTRTKNALDISHQILNNSKTHTGSIGCLSAICDLGFGAMTVLVKEINDEKALSLVWYISSLVAQKGGSFVVEKCSLAVKKQIDVFSDVGSSLAVMLRVKAQFDPTNTLNPGRFVGKI